MLFSGENTLPRAPHFMLTEISETARCAVFLYLSKGLNHCAGLSLWNPNPSLLHAHRFVTLKPVNLFSAIYCSKPLPVPASRARYVCWAAKPRFCHFERAWESLVRAIRVQNLCAWYSLKRHRDAALRKQQQRLERLDAVKSLLRSGDAVAAIPQQMRCASNSK